MTMRACRIGFCPHPAVSRSRCAVHAKPDEQQRHRFGISVYNDRRWRGKHGLCATKCYMRSRSAFSAWSAQLVFTCRRLR